MDVEVTSKETIIFGYRLRDGEELIKKGDHVIVVSGGRPSKLLYPDGRVIPFNH